MILLFQSSFRLSEKNEKDKKRKVLTPVSATPTAFASQIGQFPAGEGLSKVLAQTVLIKYRQVY